MKTVEERIKSRARDLFLQHGLKSTSVDDIAQEMGISKKTLYKYFSSKDDLVQQIVLEQMRQEREALTEIHEKSANAVDEMISIARYIIKMFRSLKPATAFDLKKYYPESWKQVERLHFEFVFQTILENLKKGMAEGYYRTDLNPEVIARLYVGKALFLVDEKYFPLSQYDRKCLVVETMQYHLRGVLNEKGLQLFNQYISEEE